MLPVNVQGRLNSQQDHLPRQEICSSHLAVYSCLEFLACGHQHWSLVCRVRSFLSPANPGITAAEALTAPFFTFDQEDEIVLEV